MIIYAPNGPVTDDSIIEEAVRLGTEAGRTAASWRFDGNTSTPEYRATLGVIEDGDPAFDIPNWLGGEWDGDPTDRSLCLELGIDPYEDEWLVDECCTQYIDAATLAYTDEVERVCRIHLSSN